MSGKKISAGMNSKEVAEDNMTVVIDDTMEVVTEEVMSSCELTTCSIPAVSPVVPAGRTVTPMNITDTFIYYGEMEDDNASINSAASSTLSSKSISKTKKRKRKMVDPIGPDDCVADGCKGVCKIQDIIDVKSLCTGIISNVSKIDDIRRVSANLQDKVSEEMIRVINSIKSATSAIKERVYSDSPAEKVREACALTVAENTKLRFEITELRVQARECTISTTPSTSKSDPIIRSIVPVPNDEIIFAKPEPLIHRNIEKSKKLFDKGNNSRSLSSPSNGVSSTDEARIVERVTDNVTRALKEFFGIHSVSGVPFTSSNVRDEEVVLARAPEDTGRSAGLNVKFDNGCNDGDVRSYDEEFPPLQRSRGCFRASQDYQHRSQYGSGAVKTDVCHTRTTEIDVNEVPAHHQEASRSRSRFGSREQRDRVDRRRPPRMAVVSIGRSDDKLSFADILRKARIYHCHNWA